MRILFVLFSFTVGGAEQSVIDLSNKLCEKNRIYIYVINNVYNKKFMNDVSEEVDIVLENRHPGSCFIKSIVKLNNFVREHNIDIIHCHSLNVPFFLILSRILNRNVKIVQTIHDIGYFNNEKKYRLWLRNKIIDKYIAISNSVRDDAIKHGINKDKIVMIHNGIDFTSIRNNLKKNIDIKRPVLGNLARILPSKKGQDLLIEALAKVKETYPNVRCYFGGGDSSENNENTNHLRKMAKILNLEKNVFFLGEVHDKDAFFNRIDIFIFPSRYEGFGLALLEAIGFGIPVITTNIEGPSEIINSISHSGLLFDGSKEDLADKIIYLIENYNHFLNRVKMNNLEQKFGISSQVKQLCRLYSKLLEGE